MKLHALVVAFVALALGCGASRTAPDDGGVVIDAPAHDLQPRPDLDAADLLSFDRGSPVDMAVAHNCIGIDGESPCPPGFYCDYPANCAPSTSMWGVCLPRPTGCDDEVAPVCGCDHLTHENACSAHAAGWDVAHDGPCDCRDSGCPAGSYCGECLTANGSGWFCIGEGMAC